LIDEAALPSALTQTAAGPDPHAAVVDRVAWLASLLSRHGTAALAVGSFEPHSEGAAIVAGIENALVVGVRVPDSMPRRLLHADEDDAESVAARALARLESEGWLGEPIEAPVYTEEEEEKIRAMLDDLGYL
jgi:hypothetical protein